MAIIKSDDFESKGKTYHLELSRIQDKANHIGHKVEVSLNGSICFTVTSTFADAQLFTSDGESLESFYDMLINFAKSCVQNARLKKTIPDTSRRGRI
jgi:hypothetical protein